MAETTENPPPQRALSALEIDLEASTAAEELRLRALEAQVEEATMGADPKARGSIELKRQAEMEFEVFFFFLFFFCGFLFVPITYVASAMTRSQVQPTDLPSCQLMSALG